MNSRIFYLTILIIVLIALSGCSRDNDNKEDCALPDLTGQIENPDESITINQPFFFDHAINNLESLNCQLETRTAGESNSVIDIDFSQAIGADFTNVENLETFVPPIPSAGTIIEEFELIFENPGVYRIITEADGTFKIEERNEENNDDRSEIEGRNINSRGLILEVKPINTQQKIPTSPDSVKVKIRRIGIRVL